MELNKSKNVKIGSPEPKRRRLRVGDPDFMPPDGGWGWLVVFACGFSNLSTFPMFQQFGLVFRQKFGDLNISNTQTTTVINLNSAFNTGVGLLNGPVYRKFTYRQVAMFGSLLVASSLFVCTMCESFWAYLIFYSACYGTGIGVTQGANALALNTFFKNRRRIATGFSWTTTALGPIVWPYIITAFLEVYGMEGTLLVFAAFSLHAFMCSLLLQPVEWHTQFKEEIVEDGPESKPFLDKDAESRFVEGKLKSSKSSKSLISGQYVFNEDDPHATGYEIIDPGHPMMVRSNDGWYSQNRSLVGSRVSLASNKQSKQPSGQNSKHPSGPTSKHPSGQNSVAVSKRPSYNNLAEARSKRNSAVNPGQESKERKRERKQSQTKPIIHEEEEHHQQENHNGGEYHEKDVLKTAAKRLQEYKNEHEDEEEHIEHKKMSFFEKVCIFFDFDLFKDPVYVNLMLGITIANFVEINFSIITPMVLEEFQFGKYQIATFMSLLGATDIVVRFFIPFIAEKIGWENRTFFLVGVLSMAFGRIILVHTQTYFFGLVVAVIIGAGKGLRTIFMALVIPTHVPLERLPAASGLQLATSGLFFLTMGPVVGWIRDTVHNYVITLHILNLLTYATAIAWTLERHMSKKKVMEPKEEKEVTA